MVVVNENFLSKKVRWILTIDSIKYIYACE